jgi:hypothetical protein
MASAARKHFAARCDAIAYSRYWILTPNECDNAHGAGWFHMLTTLGPR